MLKDIALLLIAVLIFGSVRLSALPGWSVYLIHFLVFAPFGLYLYRRKYKILASLILVFCLSSFGELCQKLFFHRVGDIMDVLIDTASAMAGWLTLKFMNICLGKRK